MTKPSKHFPLLLTVVLLAVIIISCVWWSRSSGTPAGMPAGGSTTAQAIPELATRPTSGVPPDAPVFPHGRRATSPLDRPELDEQVAAPTAAPTPVNMVAHPGDPVRVQIEAIGVDQPVIAVGLDDDRIPIVPKHHPGWYLFSAQPGMGENVVVWGHVLRFKDAPDTPAPFARVHELTLGDRVVLTTADGITYPYVVSEQVWATPNQIRYILPQGSERLTLVSCIGDKTVVQGSTNLSHRLITIAVPESATHR
jgi:sortase (surface protein transpeptidase)